VEVLVASNFPRNEYPKNFWWHFRACKLKFAGGTVGNDEYWESGMGSDDVMAYECITYINLL
jgi:hypothetical protein